MDSNLAICTTKIAQIEGKKAPSPSPVLKIRRVLLPLLAWSLPRTTGQKPSKNLLGASGLTRADANLFDWINPFPSHLNEH
jgi:hypothetical protein